MLEEFQEDLYINSICYFLNSQCLEKCLQARPSQQVATNEIIHLIK